MPVCGNVKTPDSSFSITPDKLKKLKNISKEVFESINNNKNLKLSKKNLRLRRSIFAKKNIKKNEKISFENINSLRPVIGIKSENIFNIIGKKLKKDINKDSPIFFKNLRK